MAKQAIGNREEKGSAQSKIKQLSKNQTIYDLAENMSLADLTKKISKKNKPEKTEVLLGLASKELW